MPETPDIQVLGDIIAEERTIKDIITKDYPEMADLLFTLIKCESGFDENAIGDNGMSRGILQFQKATFQKFCQGEWLDAEDQIRCGAEMIKNGLGYHWSCFK